MVDQIHLRSVLGLLKDTGKMGVKEFQVTSADCRRQLQSLRR